MDGYSKVKDIVKKSLESNIKAIALTDHGTCSNHVSFYEKCQTTKGKIKPILGNELYICLEPAAAKANRDLIHMVCFAKNKKGLKDLWKMTSYSNREDIFYYKPRINLENHEFNGVKYNGIQDFAGDIIFISGHMGSLLSNAAFCTNIFGDSKLRTQEIKEAYTNARINDPSYYEKFLKDGWLDRTCNLALKLEKISGKGNFAIEIHDCYDPTDKVPLAISRLIANSMRKVAKETNILATVSDDPHYAYREDAEEQRLMLKINLRETDESIEQKLSNSDDMDLFAFWGSNNFHIHTLEELSKVFTQEELKNSNKISDLIEDYDIIQPPAIPKFKPYKTSFPKISAFKNAQNDSDKFLMDICIQNAKEMKPWEKNKKHTKEDYWDRLDHETKIIFDAKVSDYLLICWDLLEFCRKCPKNGSFDWLNNKSEIDPIGIGSGRGSVGGSLTAYFLKIHCCDSLKYNLNFTRFYNPSRAKDLFDIDSDFQITKREKVIDYLKWKYGKDNVCQICTYGRLQGKNAIRDIIRVKGLENGIEISNKICQYIPDESKIIDDIQLAREAGETEYGIISWSLEHSEELQELYKDPIYKEIFDIAKKIESTKRNASRHASGVIIFPESVENLPLVWDRNSKSRICSFDMNDAAKVSACKFDILGLVLIDKMKMTLSLIEQGNK